MFPVNSQLEFFENESKKNNLDSKLLEFIESFDTPIKELACILYCKSHDLKNISSEIENIINILKISFFREYS
jgi:hypothetical protein